MYLTLKLSPMGQGRFSFIRREIPSLNNVISEQLVLCTSVEMIVGYEENGQSIFVVMYIPSCAVLWTKHICMLRLWYYIFNLYRAPTERMFQRVNEGKQDYWGILPWSSWTWKPETWREWLMCLRIAVLPI